MKERKDRELERALRPYTEGGEQPSPAVTLPAKEQLRAKQAEAAPAAAGADGTVQGGADAQKKAERRTAIVLTTAACLLVLIVGLFLWRLQESPLPGMLLLADGTTYVSESALEQSAHEDGGAECPACLPWVEDEEIVCCRTYTLQKGASGGEPVLYRVEYRADEVSATVYVEKSNVCLLSLGEFKKLPERHSAGGVEFSLRTEETCAYVYFEAGDYKYNLQLETGEEEVLHAALADIGESL